jgi:Ni,Fe-hydrogenase III large subunit
MIPQIRQQAEQAARRIEPAAPQIRQQAQQAAQQALNDPAVQQIVQDNPQLNEPIIIMPRSVGNGNRNSGRQQNSYGAGYTGGNGNGPLIYNP